MENFIWLTIALVSLGFFGIIFGPREMAPWEIDEEVDREFKNKEFMKNNC